jgi:hypothetical protein
MCLINKRYFFINKFYSNVLNFSYLFYINRNKFKQFNSLDSVKISSNDLRKININKNFFINKNLKVVYINNIDNLDNKFNIFDLKNIDYISLYGFFISNKIKNNIINYYKFYNNNYKLFIFMVYTNINIIKYLLFFVMFKIIYILNFLNIKDVKKLN